MGLCAACCFELPRDQSFQLELRILKGISWHAEFLDVSQCLRSGWHRPCEHGSCKRKRQADQRDSAQRHRTKCWEFGKRARQSDGRSEDKRSSPRQLCQALRPSWKGTKVFLLFFFQVSDFPYKLPTFQLCVCHSFLWCRSKWISLTLFLILDMIQSFLRHKVSMESSKSREDILPSTVLVACIWEDLKMPLSANCLLWTCLVLNVWEILHLNLFVVLVFSLSKRVSHGLVSVSLWSWNNYLIAF